jgi:aryl-alcohol dehydrogenase-like predicted oxidoreductase
MLPVCVSEGVGTLVWNPLARGRLTRAWDEATKRSETAPFAGMLYTSDASDRAIVQAVTDVAKARGVSRAQVALAWLRRNPVVVAPIVGASKMSHIDDAVASLVIDLTDEEVSRLEKPYTPRYDFQGVSDDADLARISAWIGIKPAAAA